MKKLFLPLLALTVLLSACGGPSLDETFESIRAPIAAADTVSLTAEVTARYPDRTDSFPLPG